MRRHYDNNQAGWIEDEQGCHLEPTVHPDMAGELDTTVDEWMEATINCTKEEAIRWCYQTHLGIVDSETQKTQAHVLAKAVAGIIARSNPLLQAYGLMFSCGLEVAQGVTMTEIGKKLGVTRAAVSKVSVWWKNFLGIHPSRYQKSPGACLSYSKVQTDDHWRHRAMKSINLHHGTTTPEQLKTDSI
jgi:hypothetical protein